MKSNRKQATDGEAKAKPEVIKLRLYLQARQVTQCRQLRFNAQAGTEMGSMEAAG
jgi:hypothetical protein